MNLKAALIPLGVIFIRDLLRGVPKGHTEMIRLALKSAGWNGGKMFVSENYLMAELVLSNEAAEYFLDRTLNKKSEWSNWWSDISSHCKVKYGKAHGVEECGILVGYHMMNVPIGR